MGYVPVHLATEAHHHDEAVAHSHDQHHHDHDGEETDPDHDTHAAIDHDLTLLKWETSSHIDLIFVAFTEVLTLGIPSEADFSISTPFESPPSTGPPDPRQPRAPPII